MKNGKTIIFLSVLLVLSLLLVSCGDDKSDEVAVMVALTQTAAAQQQPTDTVVVPTEANQANSWINGVVNGQSPPTPDMTVYAVDSATGIWASCETAETEGSATFSLQVPAGHYRVFAFSPSGQYGGYTTDGWELYKLSIQDGQTVSDVVVNPPGQSQCGNMFGLPASPDGRYAAIAGPTEECKTQAQTASQQSSTTTQSSQSSQQVVQSPTTVPTAVVVEESPDTTVQSFDIEEIVVDDQNNAVLTGQASLGSCNNYLLRGFAGLHVDILLQPAGTVALGAWGEDGSVLLSSVAGLNELHEDMPSDQNYIFEVCAIVQGTYDYTMNVALSN